MAPECSCANDWRVELVNLADGTRRRFAHPTGLTFENLLNEPGSASISLPVRDYTMADIWPHLTSVAITRISGPGASTTSPVCEYLGLVEDVRADSGGVLTLGMKSIEQYLQYRLLPTTSFNQQPQNQIGAALVNYANADGIPLVGVGVDGQLRDRNYGEDDDKVILEAVKQFTQVIGGPDYVLSHEFSSGHWSTEMEFVDRAGEDKGGQINARLGLSTYDIAVDATPHANKVIGVGENPNIKFTAIASETIYPLFERSEAWVDVSRQATIRQHAEGELEASLHPAASPSVTLVGTELAAEFNLGDTVHLKMDHGAVAYHGPARLIGKAWASEEGSPTSCTFSLVPLTDSADAILDAPNTGQECC